MFGILGISGSIGSTTMTNDDNKPLMGSVKYYEGVDFNKVLNESLKVFFKDAWRVAITNPAQAYHFLKIVRSQQKAARIRSGWNDQGIHVPPMLIFSITNKCNLHCKGCYNWSLRPQIESEMDIVKIRSIISEAKELGISFIMIAGGEPLVRPEILDVTLDFPEITFLVFTNGTLMTEETADRLLRQRNFIPIISLEGRQTQTDERRGEGIYQRLQRTTETLKKGNIFWGVSLTVTRENFNTIIEEKFVKDLADRGCKLFFFIEYTAMSDDTTDWLITNEQRDRLSSIRNDLRSRYPALFITIPGDEEDIGGCLSAGRGFIHINAAGDVEPCPFAPYSDASLKNMSLKDALQSEFLKKIRENHGRLHETKEGCALWAEREWIQSLLHDRNTG
jgi:MoaA/NifB/PqqE/SkfB family radical SAM enzyme